MSTLIIGATALAASTDFGKSDRKESISVKDLRERLQVDGDITVSTADGTRLLYQSGEFRTWRIGGDQDKIESNWNYENFDGSLKISLKHVWTVGDDGVIRVHFQQFDSMKRVPGAKEALAYGRKLKDETIIVKDFSPVVFPVVESGVQRVVVRFVPSLQKGHEAVGPTDMPVAIKQAVLTDSRNRVWADSVDVTAKFVALKSHLGAVAMSYFPFPGSREIGVAEGHQITVKDGGSDLKILSATPIVAGNEKLKIYGWIDLRQRTERSKSVRINASSDSANFPVDL
jgi:hypothetical protein